MSELANRLRAALADRYALERQIGAGGMATVYLALDLRHERQVAIKVLKPELAAVIGADRFLAEIRTTANLQHPHILPLYDSGQADAFLYFVMPYVAGESIRERLEREKQLPIDDAVRIATEVGEALEYAHGRGVVHRDIKPENILLHQGRVLVADFGIALAVSVAGGSRLTETGLSLGTPQYMSPEQATGDREVDGRSDVYSLGCVFYEMLAGEPPHTGPTSQAILSKILSDRPRPLAEVRDTVPPHIEAAVDTALQKLPADRFRSAAVFSDALGDARWAATLTGSGGRVAAGSRERRTTRYALGGAALVAALAIGWAIGRTGSPDPSATARVADRPSRFHLILPDSAPLALGDISSIEGGTTGGPLAITPGGDLLTWVADLGTTTQLYVRAMDSGEFWPLPGTEGASGPFFSPDGEWIGYLAEGAALYKVPARGGGPTRIVLLEYPVSGASWGGEDLIVVADRNGARVQWISAANGEAIAKVECDNLACRHPQELPGGQALVSGWNVGLVDRTTGERTTLIDQFVYQAWLAAKTRVLYPDGPARLAAVRLLGDQVIGSSVPILEDVPFEFWGAPLAVSETGVLVYAATPGRVRGSLAWLDRDGREESLPFEPDQFGDFDLSPDGARAAVVINDDLWVYDLVAGTRQQLTFEGNAASVAWSPDGGSIAFSRFGSVSEGIRQAEDGLWVIEAAGGTARLVSRERGYVNAWTAGDTLLVTRTEGGPALATEIRAQPLTGDSGRVMVAGRATHAGALSPSGRHIAYTELRGRLEVLVETVPASGQPIPVTSGGGMSPLWTKGGRELVYWGPRGQVFAVDFADGPGRPKPLFRVAAYTRPGRPFDVTADGRRFLVVKSLDDRLTTILDVVSNWDAGLDFEGEDR